MTLLKSRVRGPKVGYSWLRVCGDFNDVTTVLHQVREVSKIIASSFSVVKFRGEVHDKLKTISLMWQSCRSLYRRKISFIKLQHFDLFVCLFFFFFPSVSTSAGRSTAYLRNILCKVQRGNPANSNIFHFYSVNSLDNHRNILLLNKEDNSSAFSIPNFALFILFPTYLFIFFFFFFCFWKRLQSNCNSIF